MAKIYCKSSYLLRKDTAENWGNKNPVLRKGEQGLETDTGTIKIGDGVTAFNSLSDDNIYLPKSYTDSTFANALKGTKSDTAMLLDDISPVTHEMGVKVRGKNLFDISKITNTASLTNNGDGTITIAANSYSASTGKSLKELCPDLEIGEVITLSAITESDVKLIYLQTSQKEIKFDRHTTITQNDLDSHVSFYGHKSTSEKYGTPCIISNIQIELGTTATAYTPYVPDLTAVKVSRCGKNLFDTSKLQNVTFETYSGIPCFSYYDNANYFIYTDNFIKNTQYTFTTKAYREDGVTNKPITFNLVYTDGTKQTRIINAGEKGLVTSIAGKTLTKITGNNGYGLKCYVDLSVTQLELGTTATEYEPYITSTEYTPTADGTVEGVSSLYPNTTLTTDTDGVIIDCEYNRDINKAFAELHQAVLSMGGNT